jgi:uncharacterized protein YfeS
MTRTLLIMSGLIGLLCPNLQAQSSGDHFEFSLKTAHPNAKSLMKEDFFWSPIDESAPFGSDAGSDAAYGILKWRKTHPSASSVSYLKELFDSYAFPPFAWDELDTVKIKAYMAASNMGLSFLSSIDESIIGTAFAQFVLEGKIDPSLKDYVTKALQREMLPILTRQFGQPDQVKGHNTEIKKMLAVVNQMPTS